MSRFATHKVLKDALIVRLPQCSAVLRGSTFRAIPCYKGCITRSFAIHRDKRPFAAPGPKGPLRAPLSRAAAAVSLASGPRSRPTCSAHPSTSHQMDDFDNDLPHEHQPVALWPPRRATTVAAFPPRHQPAAAGRRGAAEATPSYFDILGGLGDGLTPGYDQDEDEDAGGDGDRPRLGSGGGEESAGEGDEEGEEQEGDEGGRFSRRGGGSSDEEEGAAEDMDPDDLVEADCGLDR